MLASMRLCSNVPAQYAVEPALSDDSLIKAHTAADGRLKKQRDLGYERMKRIPGLHCTKPEGAFYFFPRIDTARFGIRNDEQFTLDLLKKERVLIVQGTGFNWFHPDHFRIVFLPDVPLLEKAFPRSKISSMNTTRTEPLHRRCLCSPSGKQSGLQR